MSLRIYTTQISLLIYNPGNYYLLLNSKLVECRGRSQSRTPLPLDSLGNENAQAKLDGFREIIKKIYE